MTDCFGLVCTRVRRECGWMLTWEDRPEAVRGPAGTDASDHAVKEEADLFSFGTGQEENASPWTGGRGDRESVRKQQQQQKNKHHNTHLAGTRPPGLTSIIRIRAIDSV